MARKSWNDVGGVALEIVNGEHDKDLQWIYQACGARLKRMFRKGQQVRLVDTGSVELDFKIGTIMKVNTKSVSVSIPDVGDYNVSPNLLELV